MKVIAVHKDRLQWADHPEPACGRRDVIVKIYAAGVNRADLLQRRGMYIPPQGTTDIMGLECAGEIVETGSEHGKWKVGDRVCALLPGGGYAQYVNVPYRMLLPVPDEMPYEEAAALPEAFATSYLNLFTEGKLKPGERCLIHAGASGVGTAAIQLARSAGAEVYATAGREEKVDMCLELGAHAAINYREEDFFTRIVELTNRQGVDLILDTIGSAYLSKNLQLLRYRGRLLLIGLLGGARTEIDLNHVLIKNIHLSGSTLRNRSLQEKIRLTSRLTERVWPLIEQKTLKPIIDSVYSILDVEAVHDRMSENQNSGKMVLKVPHDIPTLTGQETP